MKPIPVMEASYTTKYEAMGGDMDKFSLEMYIVFVPDIQELIIVTVTFPLFQSYCRCRQTLQATANT